MYHTDAQTSSDRQWLIWHALEADDPTTVHDVRTSRSLANLERTKSRPFPKFVYASLIDSGRILLELLWRESVGFTLNARLRDGKLALPGFHVPPILNYHMIAGL